VASLLQTLAKRPLRRIHPNQPLDGMSKTPTRNSSARWFLGFFGALIAVAILPRTLLYVLRRSAGRLLAEALAILLLGFLTDRVPARPKSTRRV
jgi:hypothetical protein